MCFQLFRKIYNSLRKRMRFSRTDNNKSDDDSTACSYEPFLYFGKSHQIDQIKSVGGGRKALKSRCK